MIGVQRALASIRLPKINSNVSVQPVPAEALNVSIIIPKLLMSCAAAVALLPTSVVSSPYMLRLVSNTSVVAHCSDKASVNICAAVKESLTPGM